MQVMRTKISSINPVSSQITKMIEMCIKHKSGWFTNTKMIEMCIKHKSCRFTNTKMIEICDYS